MKKKIWFVNRLHILKAKLEGILFAIIKQIKKQFATKNIY